MVPLNSIRTFFSRSVLFGSLVQTSSFLKVSYMVGSSAAFFSGINIMMPMVGAFAGLASSCAVLGLNFLVYGLFAANPLHYLAYHIPGLFASAYWAREHWSIRLAVPVICMGLFVVHPVGRYALPYALYWLIPVALYFARQTTVTKAIGSTMTAHAVGSVIWIYTVPMTAAQWYTLIPVVAVERLLFAAAMVVTYTVGVWAVAQLQHRVSQPVNGIACNGAEK